MLARRERSSEPGPLLEYSLSVVVGVPLYQLKGLWLAEHTRMQRATQVALTRRVTNHIRTRSERSSTQTPQTRAWDNGLMTTLVIYTLTSDIKIPITTRQLATCQQHGAIAVA